ncbi:prolipoprotein diacylglyceryl transferase [Anditalea andensis]|uniref:Phosphatidylglycerol--prolipoprotein diacylglyceryl transferase n=1 Tax=Anditalea andensis TaxID=1048983 RepID=A0A074KXL5_9BACT|nr:prolipoprotein diacylglyceryl transferase [Anditalea andensis]KEO72358.1 diacylglyceryl transferase [Anditalea andensis]
MFEIPLLYTVWSPDPIIFTLFDTISLRWYSLFFALGFIISQQIMVYIFRAEGHPETLVDRLTIFMVVATIVGARLGHVLFYEPEKYLSDPLSILRVWEGGLASHGAAIAILIALWLYVRGVPAQNYLWVVDRIVIVVALTGGLIRMGNLMNSEIGGKPTGTDSGFVFARDTEESLSTLKIPITDVISYKPENRSQDQKGSGIVPINFDISISKGGYEENALRQALETDVKYVLTRFRSSQKYLAENPESPLNYQLQDKGSYYIATIETYGIVRHPTQIYESVSYFLIFIGLFIGWVKYKEKIPEGLYLGIFLVSVFGMRFIWEFLKESQVDFEEDLVINMGQLLSIPAVVGGLALIIFALSKNRQKIN